MFLTQATGGELVDRDFGPRAEFSNHGRKVIVRTGFDSTEPEPTMTASIQAEISIHQIIKALEHIARHGDYTRITTHMGRRIMAAGAVMSKKSLAHNPPRVMYCKNCGSQIFQDQFDNGGPRWVHGHSLVFACGTADGIQTIAEPASL